MIIIGGGRVATPRRVLESGWVAVEGDRIVATGIGDPDEPLDINLGGRTLLPGFVDQHCHGGGGNSFITTDPAEAFRATRLHLEHGTTSIVASLVSGSREDLADQIRALSPLVDQGVIEGIHLEGPWISKQHRGAHDPAQLRDPSQEEVGELLAIGGGRIKMVTIAPELHGGIRAIHQMVRAGVIVAVGHTDADYDRTQRAIEAGATVGTHLSNAMRALHHRDPGPVAALLEAPNVTVELIADGVHVHPAILRIVAAEAGYDRIALVTDAMSAAGAPDGHYMLGKLDVTVTDGTARLDEGGAIAGSTLTLDKAMRYMVLEGQTTLSDAVTMLSETPARTMELTDRGKIEAGLRADLVVLSPRLEIEAVMVRGDWVHHAPGATL